MFRIFFYKYISLCTDKSFVCKTRECELGKGILIHNYRSSKTFTVVNQNFQTEYICIYMWNMAAIYSTSICIVIFFHECVCRRFLETYGSRGGSCFEIRSALRENYRSDKPRFARADILSLNTDVTSTAMRGRVRACTRCIHMRNAAAGSCRECERQRTLETGINVPLWPGYIKQQGSEFSRSLQNAGPEHVYGMLEKLSCYFPSVARIPRWI